MTSPRSPAANAHPPEDFAAFLATGEPVLIVGGQAVNIWALYYREKTADLAPFVSHDIDVLGSRETLREIAALAGVKPDFFPMRPPTNEIGAVMARDTNGQLLPVEVLSFVNGVGNKELTDPAYTVALGDSGVQVRIPGPIALLKAKIANVAALSQAERQDRHHVHILSRLMPAYLADSHRSVMDDRLSEREMIDLLKNLLAIVTTATACRIYNELGINRRSMFSELTPPVPSKLHSFLTRQLPRVLPSATE